MTLLNLGPARAGLGAVLLLATASASSGGEALRVRVDCGGTYSPGQSVVLEVAVENRSGVDLEIESEVTLDVPSRGTLSLFRGVNTLPAGADYSSTELSIQLPAGAPVASGYRVTFSGRSGPVEVRDSCTFEVR